MGVRPAGVEPEPPPRTGRRLGRIALGPPGHVLVIALLAPDQAGESLALHEPRVVADSLRRSLAVEFIGFLFPLVEPRLKRRSEIILPRRERIARVDVHQTQTDRPTFPRRNL